MAHAGSVELSDRLVIEGNDVSRNGNVSVRRIARERLRGSHRRAGQTVCGRSATREAAVKTSTIRDRNVTRVGTLWLKDRGNLGIPLG